VIALYLAALAASPHAAGAPAQSPRQFIAHVYAAYVRENYRPLDRPEIVFAPVLVRAIREVRGWPTVRSVSSTAIRCAAARTMGRLLCRCGR
jgi:hypothetical protein